jgi:starch phosphorylase
MGLAGEYGAALKELGYSLEARDARAARLLPQSCACVAGPCLRPRRMRCVLTRAHATLLAQDMVECEQDAGLGNGGLGRLASCFLDSIASQELPGWGYGLRYKYGLFKQSIAADGNQLEAADDWLEVGNPWELRRNDVAYTIRFGGEVATDAATGAKSWSGGQTVRAVAYDTPIPGYRTTNTISLRLWNAEVSAGQFDLAAHNASDYAASSGPATLAFQLCAVLYPGDGTREGKALRVKQQYMLCSAALQDIMARFTERAAAAGKKPNWSELAGKVAIQMNDTHPTLAAPELMRLLMDQEGLTYDAAWAITSKCVAYTNHTVMPEALEKWPLELLEELLPRHVEIIKQIDQRFIALVKKQYSAMAPEALAATLANMVILENFSHPDPEADAAKAKAAAAADADADAVADAVAVAAEAAAPPPPAMVRMANLCVIAGHAVNGVAAIHSEIVKADVFNDFYKLWPAKFQNKTNGVTPRRWLENCNPALSAVITKWLGSDAWVGDLDLLEGLRKHADDPVLQAEWAAAKRANKMEQLAYIKKATGVSVSPDVMWDIQVKRIHEYKRQLLNILGIAYRYKQMKAMTPAQRAQCVPRACMVGGKAYATYMQAKRIVKLVNAVGAVVNADPEIGDLLKVMFVPNYNVSVAEKIIPASELSQHVSTAGTEASGTSNMKFAMNGCMLIGTLDGANVEIRDAVGHDNFFLFGALAEDVPRLRAERAAGLFKPDARFTETMEYIKSGVFGDFSELLSSLEGDEGFGRGDYFLVRAPRCVSRVSRFALCTAIAACSCAACVLTPSVPSLSCSPAQVGADFAGYCDAQDEVDKAYKDQARWTKMSIMNTAGSGFFSSDRTINQYAKEIWDIKPCPVPAGPDAKK